MTAPVTDTYATDLAAELYEELGRRPAPVPLAELSTIRRRLEDQRRTLPAQDPRGVWAEWATPALFQAGPALPLYRHADGTDGATPGRIESRLQLGGMIRRVGDFVGRRPELRAILRDLRRGVPGVVLHGIGGIGKSSLAVEIVDHLGHEAGLVVPVSGSTRVDVILNEIRLGLWEYCSQAGLPDSHPLRQVVAELIDATPPWEQRLRMLQRLVLPALPVLLLLDNAEDLLTPADNATWEVADDQLAGFLAAWVKLGGTRLIVTTRHPFGLPGRAERRLPHHHLGPLSQAETRKLLWRLPALDKLGPAELRRAYADVGGHPRSLEYLDALLAGGTARFDDIAERVETALLDRNVDDVDAWLGGVKGDLDRALAETVTLAADDVLLDALLDRLDSVPHARQLLLSASVFRQPVDDTGLAWQIAEHHPPAPDPDRVQRMNDTNALLTRARRENLTRVEVGVTDERLDEWNRDWEQLRRPPLVVPPDYPQARDTLLRLGLLSPITPTTDQDSGALYLAHRWTATALTPRTDPDDLAEAHRRAAQYWQWRVDVWPQGRVTDIQQLVEARHHYRRSGHLDLATYASHVISRQLRVWGAWTWQYDICTETLTWLPDDDPNRGSFINELGLIAQSRGDYNQAEQYYNKALAVSKELGNDKLVAGMYHQLGVLAGLRGDYAESERQLKAALSLRQDIDDRQGIAYTSGQLGRLALTREELDTAEQYLNLALPILEQIDDRHAVALAYHQLGALAHLRGDYDQAEQRYNTALRTRNELGDRPGIADSYHQLGSLAEARGDLDRAEQHYLAALAINEELGERSGIAASYHQLGRLAEQKADYDQAEQRYRVSLTISSEIGDRAGIAATTSQFGVMLTRRGKAAEAVPYNLSALSIRVTIGSPEIRTDLFWLGQQRDQLGDEHFDALLSGHLDDDSKRIVIDALDATPPPT